jgi:hypothetical protein
MSEIAETADDLAEPEIVAVSHHKFFFETPLYDAVSFSAIGGKDRDDLNEFLDGRVDAYSAKNDIDTTYIITSFPMDEAYYPHGFTGFRKVKLTCVRKPNDILYFFVGIGADSFFKVGQLPSLADLSLGDIGKKYSKYMNRSDMKEFKKAIGLAAHGVGAGSFVYLRRIFENLIGETYTLVQEKIAIKQQEFTKLRMDKKVDALKNHLPSQLVSMKRVYSILSDGVHNLTEEQCLELFPALKLSIELILQQKIEADATKLRDELAKKQIKDIEKMLNKKQ